MRKTRQPATNPPQQKLVNKGFALWWVVVEWWSGGVVD